MAWSIVGTATQQGSGTITFPGGVAQNDLAVVGMSTVGSNGWDVTSAGYTTVKTQDGANTKMRLYAKRQGASPDAGVDVGPDNGVAFLYIVRGADTSTFEDAAATSVILGAAAPLNSPSITTVTAHALVLSLVSGGTSNTAPTGAPSGYGDFVVKDFSVPTIVVVAGALKDVASPGAEDPGDFATGNAGTDGLGFTWAMRPAADADTIGAQIAM